MRFLIILSFVVVLTAAAEATGQNFFDIRASSSSGRFRVDANSPDNKGTGRKAFQGNFTFTCVDTSTKKTLWTREQVLGKALALFDDSKPRIKPQAEASPVAIYVSDSGWTVIRTAWDQLIVVSVRGKAVGAVSLLHGEFTEEETEDYVHYTTAGPRWSGLSAWYFAKASKNEYFVVRPWWGRRVFVDLKTGRTVPANDALADAARASEAQLVVATLRSREKPGRLELSKRSAAYLAGRLKMKQAIPHLRLLEESKYTGSSTIGALSDSEGFDNEVDPHSYSTFTDRQMAQLSLRRLGETPTSLPCHEFDLIQDGKKTPFIVPERRMPPRHIAIDEVKVGMSAKKVLMLVGSPDFVGHEDWSYDMDGPEPFTITLTFDAKEMTAIKRQLPLWKSGLVRDEDLAY